MEVQNTSFSSAETAFIEIFKLFDSSKYFDALDKCEKVPEPDRLSFLIQNIKANILARIGGYESTFLDFYNDFKAKTEDVVEQCQISICYAKLLKKCKRFSEAVKECNFIIEKISNEEVQTLISKTCIYRAHQLKAELMYEMLCFRTAYHHIQEAEKIIHEIDTEEPDSSYLLLKNSKILAEYNRKFQKYDAAITLLTDIYKKERKIYNEASKNSDKINCIIEEKSYDHSKNETKESSEVPNESAVKIDDGEAASAMSHATFEKPSEFVKYIDSLKVKRNINYRLGSTMSLIMYMYATKRDFSKAIRFQEEAEKYLMKSLNGNKNHIIIANFYQNTGDMYLRFEGKKYKDISYEWYDRSNKIHESIAGSKSIDCIYSIVDIGDVYLEKKSYSEAEAFYLFAKNKIEEIYGQDSIFKHRINSALVEVYTGLGTKDKGYDCAMDNVDIGMRQYGDNSIFCIGFYMSGMSANIQKGTHIIAENILTKMLKVLETENEIAYGNQYFFLASVLLGIVCYSAGKYDQAHMFFTGTLK